MNASTICRFAVAREQWTTRYSFAMTRFCEKPASKPGTGRRIRQAVMVANGCNEAFPALGLRWRTPDRPWYVNRRHFSGEEGSL